MNLAKTLNRELSTFIGKKSCKDTLLDIKMYIVRFLSINLPVTTEEKRYILVKVEAEAQKMSGTAVSIGSKNMFTTLLLEGLYMPYEDTFDIEKVRLFLFSSLFNSEEALYLYRKMFLNNKEICLTF